MPDIRATWEQNWIFMLVAFVLAFALWVSVSAEAPTQMQLPVRLEVKTDPEAPYMMTSRPPDRVEVLFRGSGRDLLRVFFAKPRLVATVDAVRSRVQEVELDPGAVALPEGANVVALDVRPRRLVLRFEPAMERSVAVAARVDVLPAPGYALAGPVRVTPSHVRLRGAESAARSIDTLWTVPVRLEGLHGSEVRQVELERPDVQGPLELSSEAVRIEVSIEPAAEKVLADVPVRLVGSGAEALVPRPAKVRVTVRGPQSAVSRLTPDDVDARVRVNGERVVGGWRAVEVRLANPYLDAVTADSVRLVVARG